MKPYKAGASMREIARAVGMTHPGVRSILIRDGGPSVVRRKFVDEDDYLAVVSRWASYLGVLSREVGSMIPSGGC